MQSPLMGPSHHSQGSGMSDGQSVGSGRRARQSKQNFQLQKKQAMLDEEESKKKLMNDSMSDLQPLKMDDAGF